MSKTRKNWKKIIRKKTYFDAIETRQFFEIDDISESSVLKEDLFVLFDLSVILE